MPTNSREEGFTLLELLIVIVIVGLLAAIAVPVYLNQRSKAYDAAMHADLHNAVTAETAYNVSNGSYAISSTDLTAEGYRVSSGVTPVHVRITPTAYIACVKHTAVKTWLVYDAASGAVTRSSSDCA